MNIEEFLNDSIKIYVFLFLSHTQSTQLYMGTERTGCVIRQENIGYHYGLAMRSWASCFISESLSSFTRHNGGMNGTHLEGCLKN